MTDDFLLARHQPSESCISFRYNKHCPDAKFAAD
jgi:hypothetical protein